MEIYSTFQIAKTISYIFSKNYGELYSNSLVIGCCLWLGLFLLQGTGLYIMAKKREMKNKWLSFIPFVNILYITKLAGECQMFGRNVKRVGVYAMVLQIVTVLVTVVAVSSEIYLYVNHGGPIAVEDYFADSYWTNLTGFEQTIEDFYIYGNFFLSIFQLAFGVLMMIIMTALCKKYAPKNFMPLSMLAFFVPLSRFIIIFCLRNRKAIDYEAYMREKREEFMRRQQQYRNMYGNPYNNPYNNPYGNPYYRGQNPYGQNPYNQDGQNTNQNSNKEAPKEEPFSEFASNKSAQDSSANSTNNSQSAQGKNNGGDSDDFFA